MMTQKSQALLRAERHIRRQRFTKKTVLTVVIFAFALLYFFPILYMFLTGMKTEIRRFTPGSSLSPPLKPMRRSSRIPACIPT